MEHIRNWKKFNEGILATIGAIVLTIVGIRLLIMTIKIWLTISKSSVKGMDGMKLSLLYSMVEAIEKNPRNGTVIVSHEANQYNIVITTNKTGKTVTLILYEDRDVVTLHGLDEAKSVDIDIPESEKNKIIQIINKYHH